MQISRRQVLKSASCGCVALPLLVEAFGRDVVQAAHAPSHTIGDQLAVLPPGALKLEGYLERYIQLSIKKWSKGVVPYKALTGFFRTGRPNVCWEGRSFELFAAGEMWGKAIRSAALFYRYTGDSELKEILNRAVADLLSTRRQNGTISCSTVDKQPDGPGGDIWERKYVLLGLDEYYEWVERDPAVLNAMIDEADATIQQVGLPPKVRIVDLGWSPNHIESSAILEPILRLYKRTGDERYLTFARYIVETEGGAKRHNIFDETLADLDPVEIGGIYPKAYEMLSVFEGLTEYHRVTAEVRWREVCLKLFHKVIDREITIIGNGGGDQPYHPNVAGEAWDNTAFEQTNPDIRRMMETCTGVTWLKFCSQILRLTADPIAVDYIELYAYNGLIGAMKPEGDGFSYVNLLNGIKTEPKGWGATIDNVYVTCCNLNGPVGLAYLPLIAVMRDREGLVVNLFNAGTATISHDGADICLAIITGYPVEGRVLITVTPRTPMHCTVKIRIPSWSKSTKLKVNGQKLPAQPARYARIEREWKPGDVIELDLDMRCRLIRSRRGLSEHSDEFHALMCGPIVLARDENIDAHFDQAVDIIADDGIVAVKSITPRTGAIMQLEIPTYDGTIQVVDYASVNSWNGKRVQTWLPIKSARDRSGSRTPSISGCPNA